MSAALDTAQIVIPGLLALGGGYYGARWQTSREVDAEIRAVVDDAVRALQGVNQAMVGARSHFIQEGLKTTPAGYTALGELEAKVADAQEVQGRLLVRTEQGSHLPVHFLNALLAIGRANDQMRTAALMPADDMGGFDLADGWKKIQVAIEEFDNERAQFLRAARNRVAPRVGMGQRIRKRLLPGDG